MMPGQLELMHRMHGSLTGARCRTCPHLEAYCNMRLTRVWYRCQVYEDTSGGMCADWRPSWPACGAFRQPREEAEDT